MSHTHFERYGKPNVQYEYASASNPPLKTQHKTSSEKHEYLSTKHTGEGGRWHSENLKLCKKNKSKYTLVQNEQDQDTLIRSFTPVLKNFMSQTSAATARRESETFAEYSRFCTRNASIRAGAGTERLRKGFILIHKPFSWKEIPIFNFSVSAYWKFTPKAGFRRLWSEY